MIYKFIFFPLVLQLLYLIFYFVSLVYFVSSTKIKDEK